MPDRPSGPRLAYIFSVSSILKDPLALHRAELRGWHYAMKSILGRSYHSEERNVMRIIAGVRPSYIFSEFLGEAARLLSHTVGSTVSPEMIQLAFAEFISRSQNREFESSIFDTLTLREGIPTLFAMLREIQAPGALLMRYNFILELAALQSLGLFDAFAVSAELGVAKRMSPNALQNSSPEAKICSVLLDIFSFKDGKVLLLDTDDGFTSAATFGLLAQGYNSFGIIRPGDSTRAKEIWTALPKEVREHKESWRIKTGISVLDLIEFVNLTR